MGIFSKKSKEEREAEQRRRSGMPDNPIVCPFCGNRSKSEKYCTSCGTKFTKEVKAIAYREKDDPRPDGLGRFTRGQANAIIGVVIGILIALFVIFTQINQGITG